MGCLVVPGYHNFKKCGLILFLQIKLMLMGCQRKSHVEHNLLWLYDAAHCRQLAEMKLHLWLLVKFPRMMTLKLKVTPSFNLI